MDGGAPCGVSGRWLRAAGPDAHERQPTVTFISKQKVAKASSEGIRVRRETLAIGAAVVRLRYALFRDLVGERVLFCRVCASLEYVIGRVRTLQLESLILAQNERWRQA